MRTCLHLLPVFSVPYDMLTTRVATQGATSAGGADGDNNRPQSYIEVLRDTSVLMRMGITHIPGLNSNIKIPKKTSTFSFKAENTSSGDTNVTISTVDLELQQRWYVTGIDFELQSEY